MAYGATLILGFCILLMQLLQLDCHPPSLDPEVRAHLEAKVMSSMSLKELEEMVEKDERVMNVPKSKFVIVPKPKNNDGEYTPEDLDHKAYIIQRKSKKYPKKATSERMGYGFPDKLEDIYGRSSYEPKVFFESAFKYDEQFPSLFGIGDLESAGSSPVKQFYESIVQKVVNENKNEYMKDPFAFLEASASEDIPSYTPRFNYDAYSKDTTETKLKGKPYWKDGPERREEADVDEKGCRTIVKKIVDPEEKKKTGKAEAKSVIITKECEYPSVEGPDAKIPEMPSNHRISSSQLESQPSVNYDSELPSYESSRPIELDTAKSSDPLEPDYIDRMLETHFRSFPTFSNPITSFKGYQDRFNLRTPSGFKDVKPTVDVHSYEYSHPESGFSKDNERESDTRSLKSDTPVTYERQQQYEHEDNTPREAEPIYRKSGSPKPYEHHYHYDYPEKSLRKEEPESYDDQKEYPRDAKQSDKKEPKMMKKSFAYYRKDNPKQDPNDQHFAEEYAQGSFRSFSSDYDSERDGPKKE
ncbi:unnamed protein product [Larinioides sclopetarius]|uniref:Uncharacterized protein n=1 Tax=Larinioides sclopetarius TaxID=280406 RepID=A0AAV2A1I4_9ARAC